MKARTPITTSFVIKLRKELGLSRRAFALKLQYSQPNKKNAFGQVVCNIEAGNAGIGNNFLYKLMQAFPDIDKNFLIDCMVKDYRNNLTKDIEDFFNIKLTKKGKKNGE